MSALSGANLWQHLPSAPQPRFPFARSFAVEHLLVAGRLEPSLVLALADRRVRRDLEVFVAKIVLSDQIPLFLPTISFVQRIAEMIPDKGEHRAPARTCHLTNINNLLSVFSYVLVQFSCDAQLVMNVALTSNSFGSEENEEKKTRDVWQRGATPRFAAVIFDSNNLNLFFLSIHFFILILLMSSSFMQTTINWVRASRANWTIFQTTNLSPFWTDGNERKILANWRWKTTKTMIRIAVGCFRNKWTRFRTFVYRRWQIKFSALIRSNAVNLYFRES